MSGEIVGSTNTKNHAPLVERSKREYEVILVVNPGKTESGVALGVVNPDGSCQFVTGRERWDFLKLHLPVVDIFVGCYWNAVEEATAIEMAQTAKKAGCASYVQHATFEGIQAVLPTRPERAGRVMTTFLSVRGIDAKRYGRYSRRQFKYILPRLGARI